jgi:hypothetical protein
MSDDLWSRAFPRCGWHPSGDRCFAAAARAGAATVPQQSVRAPAGGEAFEIQGSVDGHRRDEHASEKRSQIRQIDVGAEFGMLIALPFGRRFAKPLLNFSGLVNRGHPYQPVMKSRCRA